MKNAHLVILVTVLVLAGLSLFLYKVWYLKFPVFPSEKMDVWNVEARLQFNNKKSGSVRVDLFIPKTSSRYIVINEKFISGNYGISTKEEADNRLAEWTARRVSGKQVLYFQQQLARSQNSDEANAPAIVHPTYPDVPKYPETRAPAINALLKIARAKSIDTSSFTRELLFLFNKNPNNENVNLLLQESNSIDKFAAMVRNILAGARIPTRLAYFLELKDGIRHGALKPYLQVFNGSQWITFNLRSGREGIPDNHLLWYVGDHRILTIKGARNPILEFSVSRYALDPVIVAERMSRKENSIFMNFSLFSLPIQTQNVYRILLVVPLGALLMVILRNIVGLKTFGTFMPILIALAFRETELFWGVILFSLLVGLGLLIRFYLEYLRLLLVPRLAAVLIIVILLMAIISIVSHKLGLERGLSVALFPMVIMAMTIERMSLVWEQHGASEALQQGLGTLLVAALGYLVMDNSEAEHIIFVFPELLLVILAVILLLGRYTGYRVTELWRFRALMK